MFRVVYDLVFSIVTRLFQFVFLATERLCGLASPPIDPSA